MKGREVCYHHGGKTPAGVASPNFKTGRYSKYLPDRLSNKYLEAREDAALLELRDEIALLGTRAGELLENLQDGDTRQLWKDLRETWDALEDAVKAGDKPKQGKAIQEMGSIIKRGNAIYASWAEIYNVTDQRRKTVESERKRLVEMQQMITAERMLLLVGAILGVIQRHVTDTKIISVIRQEFRELSMVDTG